MLSNHFRLKCLIKQQHLDIIINSPSTKLNTKIIKLLLMKTIYKWKYMRILGKNSTTLLKKGF